MKSNANETEKRGDVGSGVLLARMVELEKKWSKYAAFAFKSAKLEPDVMGKKLIEHGAVCYASEDAFFESSLDALASAVFRVRPFVTEAQWSRLDGALKDYQAQKSPTRGGDRLIADRKLCH